MTVPDRWKENVLGSSLTSIKIGGTIRYLSRPKNREEIEQDIQLAERESIPYRTFGGGSNLVLPDAGFAGLLIQPAGNICRILSREEAGKYEHVEPAVVENRYLKEGEEYLHLADTAPHRGEYTYVEIEAGVPWGQAVIWSLKQHLVGLHWYARIPCNVGGAVYNNIHGEQHFLSESIVEVRGIAKAYAPSELDFGYDHSIFHKNVEVIVSVILRLTNVSEEVAAQAKQQYLAWTQAKNNVQPIPPNCGSVFQNITHEEASLHGETAVAAAYYIDQKCGLRGEQEGGVQVAPLHGNFIINTGGGTQREFITLVERLRERVFTTCGIHLQPEVECMTETGERHIWK